MPFLSENRDRVFVPVKKLELQIGEFPDFYAILEVESSAKPREIEEAIFARGADLLAASFSRGAKSQLLDLLDKYQTVFRRVLLVPDAKTAYDELLVAHRKRAEDAATIEEFLEKWAPAPPKKTALVRAIEPRQKLFRPNRAMAAVAFRGFFPRRGGFAEMRQ